MAIFCRINIKYKHERVYNVNYRTLKPRMHVFFVQHEKIANILAIANSCKLAVNYIIFFLCFKI